MKWYVQPILMPCNKQNSYHKLLLDIEKEMSKFILFFNIFK